MSTACTPLPVEATLTLPAASIVSRSPTLSTAFVAVGAQTLSEQLIFCVAADEIVTSAHAPLAAATAIAAKIAVFKIELINHIPRVEAPRMPP
jgi:hypothetical protein